MKIQPAISNKSGFEVCVKRREDGSELSWESHQNPCEQKEPFNWYVGKEFDSSHELWRYLKHGDFLAVFGVAIYRFWQCNGLQAYLLFDTFFDPTGV